MIDPLLLRIIFVAGWTVLTALIILINIVWRKIKRIKASKIKRQEQADATLSSFIKLLFLIIVIAVAPCLDSCNEHIPQGARKVENDWASYGFVAFFEQMNKFEKHAE